MNVQLFALTAVSFNITMVSASCFFSDEAGSEATGKKQTAHFRFSRNYPIKSN